MKPKAKKNKNFTGGGGGQHLGLWQPVRILDNFLCFGSVGVQSQILTSNSDESIIVKIIRAKNPARLELGLDLTWDVGVFLGLYVLCCYFQ
jgi:hypothetical protein